MRKFRPVLTDYLLITGGVVLVAASFNLFLIPNRITPGGFSGLATLLHYALGVPVGTTMAALNVPLFILGFKKLGMAFVVRSAYGTLLLSVLIDVFAVPPATDDLLLCLLYGGMLMGIGLGLALRGGGSTGGSDMLARVLHAYKSTIGVGTFIVIVDFLVIVGAGVLFSPQLAMRPRHPLRLGQGGGPCAGRVRVVARVRDHLERANEVADEICTPWNAA